MIQLLDIQIDDRTTPGDLERIRRNLVEVVRELQRQPAKTVIRDVVLADGVATPIAHRRGRPVTVTVSPVRGAASTGRIEEVRDGTHDRALYVVLKATGWGASIIVDVEVVPL